MTDNEILEICQMLGRLENRTQLSFWRYTYQLFDVEFNFEISCRYHTIYVKLENRSEII